LNKLIFTRIFIEASTETEAQYYVDQIMDKFKIKGSILNLKVSKYWKIQDYYEISFQHQNTNLIEMASIMGEGWHLSEREAILEPKISGHFYMKFIKWCHIEEIASLQHL
jgi:hypothetical protein